MATVLKSVLVPHSARTMFELVDDCARYPEFLPWCAGVEVFERTPQITRARLDIDYHGLESHIATVNTKQPYERIDLEFVEGPFDRFKGHWRFLALGDSGCRVEFSVDYAFSSGAMDRMLAPVFGHIIETLVERFVMRADALAEGRAGR
jgi:ribosome-associated toxin RatA of RatAB toxin-antitoxin module